MLIGHARDHAVCRLVIELEEVWMEIDLGGLKVRKVVVQPFAGEGPIHTVVHACPEDQRVSEIVVLPNGLFLFVQDIDQPQFIDDRGLLAFPFADFNRYINEVEVVILTARVFRAEAPDAVLSRLGWIDAAAAVLILMDHLQPGSRVMVW